MSVTVAVQPDQVNMYFEYEVSVKVAVHMRIFQLKRWSCVPAHAYGTSFLECIVGGGGRGGSILLEYYTFPHLSIAKSTQTTKHEHSLSVMGFDTFFLAISLSGLTIEPLSCWNILTRSATTWAWWMLQPQTRVLTTKTCVTLRCCGGRCVWPVHQFLPTG